nr:hypothetical protein [Tanacetum cinerariifolium]
MPLFLPLLELNDPQLMKMVQYLDRIEEEEAVKRIKGEALKEKDDPSAFIFPIRLEGKVNKNALEDIGSDINTMPYRSYETLGREEMKKIDRGGNYHNCKISYPGYTNRPDAPIMVGFDVMRIAESDSDDEEEYAIKRNKFGAPIYGPKPAPYLNYTNLEDRSSAIQTVTNPFRKIRVWKKAISFLGSLLMPLKKVNWKPDYKGSYTKEEEATG